MLRGTAAKGGQTKTELHLANGQSSFRDLCRVFFCKSGTAESRNCGDGHAYVNASLSVSPQGWAGVNNIYQSVEMSTCQRCRQINHL